jgi:hypothetical protein
VAHGAPAKEYLLFYFVSSDCSARQGVVQRLTEGTSSFR